MSFTLPALGYATSALAPAIDEKTMEIHHGKHHQGYTNKLNTALESASELSSQSIEDILAAISTLPGDKQGGLRNNGGGFYNHSLFWKVIGPEGDCSEGDCSGELAEAIDKSFGSLSAMKEAFEKAATTQFGSGWAWLVYCGGELKVSSTPNQDNPLMKGLVGVEGVPILGLDVWEHAYYLNYQNRRPDYVKAFWSIVNWKRVAENFVAAKGGKSVIC